jgi:competence protein ComEC
VPSRPVKIRALLAALWIAGSCLLVVASGPIDSPVVRIVFINVGHGDAILVDYGDTEILIDAGTYTTPSSAKELLCQVHRYVDDDRIELAVVTHPDKDHYGGFIALLGPREPAAPAESISVAEWRLFFPTLTGTPVSEKPTFRGRFEALSRTPNTGDAPPDYLQVPKSVFNDNDLRLFAIPAARFGDSDARAPILIIEYAGTAVVLSGDSRMWQGVEEELRGRFQTVALLAPHHGHEGDLQNQLQFASFLGPVVPSPGIPSPGVIIISDNSKTSLPASMLSSTGRADVYSTADKGTIVLTTDGTRFACSFNGPK